MLDEKRLDGVAADTSVGSCTGATDSTLDGCVIHHCVLLDGVLGDCVWLGSEFDECRPDEDVLDICMSGDCTASKDVAGTSVLDAFISE